jgi:nicotinamidase-related amidase
VTSTAHDGGLRFGPLRPNWAHICVDMQRLFAEDTDWKTPWMERVLPNVSSLVAALPSRTIFTRFIPAERPGQGEGTWARYWTKWAHLTLERLPPGMIDLVGDLARFAPPAVVVDKTLYSPWLSSGLGRELDRLAPEALIVTGCETDVCVLATVLGAVDRGYRTIVVTDAICSSSDETHDALIEVYERRYGEQVETITTVQALTAVKGVA